MRGRPKKYQTNKEKVKSLRLNDKAAYLLQQIRKERPDFDFSKYVSRHLVRDFGDNSIEKKIQWKKEQLAESQKEIDQLYKKNNEIAEEIRALQEQKVSREIEDLNSKASRVYTT